MLQIFRTTGQAVQMIHESKDSSNIIAVESLGSTVFQNLIYISLCLHVSVFVLVHTCTCMSKNIYVYCLFVSAFPGGLLQPASAKGVSDVGINDS